MNRTLVQFSLLTLFVFASVADGIAQDSSDRLAQEVIGNGGSSKMSVIKEPLREPIAKTDPAVSRALMAHPPIYVTVMGQVSRPGVYEFRNGAPTLPEVVEQAGNLTRFCGHQFFVFKANEESLQLEPRKDRKDAGYKFDDGDILLAETSARHYRAIGTASGTATLSEIHPLTQLVLLNVLERPVLVSLPPEDAKLVYLLSLLNQDRTAMVGVEQILPPNASAVPPDALIAPSTIFSGSILRFEPGAINRKSLPRLPDPELVQMSSKVQMLSAERESPAADWPRDPGSLMVQPVKSDSQNPFAAGPAIDAGSVPPAETETSGNPFDDAFAEFETTSSETLSSDSPDILVPDADNTAGRALLSKQQWRIIVTFMALMSLFLLAWYIRHRRMIRGAKTISFIESQIAAPPAAESPSGEDTVEGPEDEVLTATADAELSEHWSAVPGPEPQTQDDAIELDGLKNSQADAESAAGHVARGDAYELSSYDSPRSEEFIDENTYEVSIEELGSNPEIEVFNPVENPRETVSETVASMRDDLPADEPAPKAEIHHLVDELDGPASRVQQSILGRPWIQEASNVLDPQESDISLDEHPVDSPEAAAEMNEAKTQASPKAKSGRSADRQFRIDQAHTVEPRAAKPPQLPEAASNQSLPDAASASNEVAQSAHPSAASKWLKMKDHPQQPDENLDHIFQAIMRDRKK